MAYPEQLMRLPGIKRFINIWQSLKNIYFCSPKFSSGLNKWNFRHFRLPEEIVKSIKMYAIVEIAGQQFRVEKDQKVFVHRLEEEEGTSVEFKNVLLVDNDGKVKVGTPKVRGARVNAKVLEHLKGNKVIVFKKKRRKGYKKKNGHRQYLTQIQIEEIIG